eukprot:g6120.t1
MKSSFAAPCSSTEHVAEPLIDSFGRVHEYLRVSLTERCNLRCQYCMPENGVELQPNSDLMSDDEIVRVAKVFASRGVNKIRLTGGEPLLRPTIVELVERLRSIDGIEKLGITTNALVLERKLPRLIEAGVTQFNISLDTLVSAKFNFITRRRGFSRVLSAIQATEEAYRDASVVKVNCVVMRGMNEDEIVDFVNMTKDRKITVRFIEYMPFDSNKWKTKKLVPFTEMLSEIRNVHSDLERIGDTPCATQKTYRVPNFLGQIGFVTSMTNHFCGGCNRLRLTADGNLKACLFGEEEISLRDQIRAGARDEDIEKSIEDALGRKHAALGGHADIHKLALGNNRPMILIGG